MIRIDTCSKLFDYRAKNFQSSTWNMKSLVFLCAVLKLFWVCILSGWLFLMGGRARAGTVAGVHVENLGEICGLQLG